MQHDDISSKKKKSVNLNKKIKDLVDKRANEILTKTGNVEPNFRTIVSNQQPMNTIQHEQVDLVDKRANEILTGNVEPNSQTIFSNQQPINAKHEQMDLDSKIQAIVEAKVVYLK